jgi:hypothetical protein
MKKLILGLALAIFLACAPPSMAQAAPQPVAELHISDVFVKQVELINQMNETFPLVDIQIVRTECKQENSFYWSRDLAKQQGWVKPRIELCSEMDKYPDAALMFAAHEMGHAISDFYTDTLDEQNADELGALAMIAFGHQKELLGSVQYYLSDDVQGHVPGDDHPSNGFRAWFLTCMEQGSEKNAQDQMCVAVYNGTSIKWFMRLTDSVEKLEPSIDDLIDILL